MRNSFSEKRCLSHMFKQSNTLSFMQLTQLQDVLTCGNDINDCKTLKSCISGVKFEPWLLKL
jgi:hypothetical protein